jgi:hypothetical protein
MAGISVTLEGNNIQLAFEKNDNTTAVVMDAGTAQALILALGQMLLSIEQEAEPDAYGEDDFFEFDSPTIDVGTDERGGAVIAVEPGAPPSGCCRRGSAPGSDRTGAAPAWWTGRVRWPSSWRSPRDRGGGMIRG